MKHLIPALLLAAAIPAFAADAPTDDTVVETHAVQLSLYHRSANPA